MPQPILVRVRDAPPVGSLTGADGVEWVLGGPKPEATDRPILAVAFACDSASLVEALPRVNAALVRAATVGARVLNVTIPPIGGSRDPGIARYQDGVNFTYEILHTLRFEAEAMGVALAVEAPSEGCLLSPVELREIIDAANSSAVGACVNLARVEKVGCSADWIITLGRRVRAIRASGVTGLDLKAGAPASSPIIVEPADLAGFLAARRERGNGGSFPGRPLAS